MRASSFSLLGFSAAFALGVGVAAAEDTRPRGWSPQGVSAGAQAESTMMRPFTVGEKLTYNAKINFLHVGSGTMSVEAIDTIRGRPVYHTVFRVKGRMLFFSVNDMYESWFDTATFSSMRYKQNIDEGSYEADRHFEMYPERQTFSTNNEPEVAGVAQPLDEGSFLYFVRTLPLEVGDTYEFFRYFRPDRNPVRLEVLRREVVKVPAGEFKSLVVRPSIKSKGIFSSDSKAEIWFSDDSLRLMLKMRSGLPFGTLQLELKDIYRPTRE
jgi:hypothetical protein